MNRPFKQNKMIFVSLLLLTLAAMMLIQKLQWDPSLNGFLIGFTSSISAVLAFRLTKKIRHPQEVAQEAIDMADERNVMIDGKAGFAHFRVITILLTGQLVLYYFMDNRFALIVSFVMLALSLAGFGLLKFYYDKHN